MTVETEEGEHVLHSARKLVLVCTRALAVVAMVAVAMMMLTITYDVVMRFAFAAPTDWAYPLNSAAVLAATALAAPHLYATGHHISMDLLHRALPPGGRRFADVATAVATTFLGVVLAITGFRSMAVAWSNGLVGAGTFNIPLWVPDAVLFVTGVFLVLVALLFPPSAGEAAAVPGEASARADQQSKPALVESPGDAR
jgi:TRAP-type C4-dicarboxylate transport system permease small subunit